MANSTNCIVVNPTATAFTNVNGGGDDVPAYSMLVCTLTDAEATALITDAGKAGVAILANAGTAPTAALKHWASKVLRIGQNPGA